jgi:hypothetical protein
MYVTLRFHLLLCPSQVLVPSSKAQASLSVAVRVRPTLKSEQAAAGSSSSSKRDIIRVMDGKIVVVLDPDEAKDYLDQVQNRTKEKRYTFDVAYDTQVCGRGRRVQQCGSKQQQQQQQQQQQSRSWGEETGTANWQQQYQQQQQAAAALKPPWMSAAATQAQRWQLWQRLAQQLGTRMT